MRDDVPPRLAIPFCGGMRRERARKGHGDTLERGRHLLLGRTEDTAASAEATHLLPARFFLGCEREPVRGVHVLAHHVHLPIGRAHLEHTGNLTACSSTRRMKHSADRVGPPRC
jgi:hypothetical protein